MQSTLEMAEQRARAVGANQIHEIRVRVGQMTGVVPEALEHAFVVLREGTLAEKAQLAVEYVPAICWCDPCQKEFQSPELYSECPECGTASYDVRGGMEMELISLEVD